MSLPYAPLTDAEILRRRDDAAKRAGSWLAVSLAPADGTLAAQRNALANAERAAAELLTWWAAERRRRTPVRERGGALADD